VVFKPVCLCPLAPLVDLDLDALFFLLAFTDLTGVTVGTVVFLLALLFFDCFNFLVAFDFLLVLPVFGVGDMLGETYGDLVGDLVGGSVGDLVGGLVGDLVGDIVEDRVGTVVGDALETVLGDVLGRVLVDTLGTLLLVGPCDKMNEYGVSRDRAFQNNNKEFLPQSQQNFHQEQ
jgi:hypothetical protein